jgi:hypothetical protein
VIVGSFRVGSNARPSGDGSIVLSLDMPVFKKACAAGLRRHCRGAEAHGQDGAKLAGYRRGEWPYGGVVAEVRLIGELEVVHGGVAVPVPTARVPRTEPCGRTTQPDGTGVTATVLHPGVVRTAFAAEDPSLLAKVMITVSRPFLKTPAQGAATSIYLATAPEVEGVTGQYFAHRRPKTSK